MILSGKHSLSVTQFERRDIENGLASAQLFDDGINLFACQRTNLIRILSRAAYNNKDNIRYKV